MVDPTQLEVPSVDKSFMDAAVDDVVLLEVTKGDVLNGQCGLVSKCAVALAINRAVGVVNACRVDLEVDSHDWVRVRVGGREFRGDEASLKFIEEFDSQDTSTGYYDENGNPHGWRAGGTFQFTCIHAPLQECDNPDLFS